MGSATFHERRKKKMSVTQPDRRNGDRRKKETLVALNKRRLIAQVRQYERLNFRIPIRLKLREQEISGHTSNISHDGLMVVCGATMAVGTPLALQFSFGVNFCYMNIAGQVIFCSPMGNGAAGQLAVGIKFSAIREIEKKVLSSAITELKQSESARQSALLSINVSKDFLAIEAARIDGESSRTLLTKPSRVRHSCVHASKVIGWGSYLPPLEITTQDISSRLRASGYKNVGEVIEAMTGIKSRRYANSDQVPSDLAAEASLQALQSAGMDPKDLDAIIFCGVSRDFEEPATANIVQEKIGATNSYVFDMSNACNGFMSAVDVADSMIASGRYEKILVAVGEMGSLYIDWEPKSKRDLKLSSMSYTLGDGGGAALLTRIDDGEERGVRARWFLSDGSQWRVAIIPPVLNGELTRSKFKSDGAEIERVAARYIPVGVETVLESLGWTVDDIDLVIPHQVASPVTKNILYNRLQISPEKVIWTFPKYGNNGAASMPVAMCEALKSARITSGGKVVFIGGSGGFGAGVLAMTI